MNSDDTPTAYCARCDAWVRHSGHACPQCGWHPDGTIGAYVDALIDAARRSDDVAIASRRNNLIGFIAALLDEAKEAERPMITLSAENVFHYMPVRYRSTRQVEIDVMTCPTCKGRNSQYCSNAFHLRRD